MFLHLSGFRLIATGGPGSYISSHKPVPWKGQRNWRGSWQPVPLGFQGISVCVCVRKGGGGRLALGEKRRWYSLLLFKLLAVKNQYCCVDQGNWPDSQEPAPLCGSRELTWQQGPAPQCGSRELTWQPKTSTAVWVKGTDLAVKGQYPCVGQGNRPDSQELVPLCGSREQTWQSRTSTAVWVKGTDLAVKN